MKGTTRAKVRKFGPRLSVSLTGRDYEALSALAEKDEVSVAWVVRRAIERYLQQRRNEAEPGLPFHSDQTVERGSVSVEKR